jgi:hypothetical protein
LDGGSVKPTITENKKLILSDYLRQLGNEISNLYHTLENDETVPNESFKVYDQMIEKLNYLHTQLEEEIYFS